jgi:tyrosinase
LDIHNPSLSPVFDGSPTSLGGDGAFIPHQGLILPQALSGTLIPLQPGSGSGCVHSGPFANMTVHFGPIILPQYGAPNYTGVPDPLNDHARCLKRDLNAYVASRWNSFRNTTSLILNHNTIEMFQAIMQGDDRYITGSLGVHGGGHYIIGGDPGGDPFISPGDPAFYLHHAQIDRIYWIWQMLDFPNRQVSKKQKAIPHQTILGRLVTICNRVYTELALSKTLHLLLT